MVRPQPRYHLHNKTQQKGWGSRDWQNPEGSARRRCTRPWSSPVGEVPSRKGMCVATALLLGSGTNDVAFPQEGAMQNAAPREPQCTLLAEAKS